ncbi:unnamed protein product [Bursaphelenchus xylophilus]|uniref:(pine wood nematode) hypothetical protein n=1 Tax=Bursaphelenchus xylophilus TaxID=6326 RepID=A0A1I7RV80_BURXY|nr:unnamed protein product [Bursaphelenchus xylophilus]CAG9086505.1 unnamed protein product [Bursaphelenchus xylophilus]
MSMGQAEIAISDATLPIDMKFDSFTPNSDSMSTLSPLSFLDGLNKKERKRRRVIGNHDNTLDGLVAKRVDLGPDTKRYQTENEAIELPDDEVEIKRLETDPDVSTRMCSICGYQGKWVSEMVRHKRVHTSERPFKCKYCNRTSKWKADLIRHVAKTHGIRVVSKYSRSKAFDTQTDQNTRPKKDENNNKSPFLFQSPVQGSPASTASSLSPSTPFYKCQSCFFESESVEGIQQHLDDRHNQNPFDCRACQKSFKDIREVSAHFLQSTLKCTAISIKLNFSINDSSKASSLLTVSTSSGLVHSESDNASTSGVSSCASSRDDFDVPRRVYNCSDCAFNSTSEEQFDQHKQGHEPPKGLFTYKCVFCSWNSKKKSAIEKHLNVHTADPSQFMPQVEKNFLAPVLQPVQPVSSTSSALQCLAQLAQQSQLFGATAPQFPMLPEGLNAFGLLSTLCNAQRNQLPGPLMGAVPGGSPMNFNAVKDMPQLPFMAYGLCSLLGNLSKQSPTVTTPAINGQSVSSSPLTANSFDQFV